MKLFPIRGGIHPEYRKDITSEKAITVLPMPSLLYIPLQQHIGAPAEVLVSVGDLVKKGQMIARNQGAVSASHQAPASGRIKEITEVAAPHPSGLPQTTIILESDGKDEWGDPMEPIADPFAVEPRVIHDRVAQSGIVGMGGAAFPSAIKLNPGEQKKLDTIPFQNTDFVFTIIGEEGGLVGSTLVLIAFGFFFYRIWLIYLNADETYYRMIAAGLLGMLAFHTIINLGMVLQLLPVVGLWLPFMSYGGTAMWLCMACVGLLLNIRSKERKVLF